MKLVAGKSMTHLDERIIHWTTLGTSYDVVDVEEELLLFLSRQRRSIESNGNVPDSINTRYSTPFGLRKFFKRISFAHSKRTWEPSLRLGLMTSSLAVYFMIKLE